MELNSLLNISSIIFVISSIIFFIAELIKEHYKVYVVISRGRFPETGSPYLLAKPFNKKEPQKLAIYEQDYPFFQGRTNVFIKYDYMTKDWVYITKEEAEIFHEIENKKKWAEILSNIFILILFVSLLITIGIFLYLYSGMNIETVIN